jgi:hypothetical protein
MNRDRKNKQVTLEEICQNVDFQLENLKETLTRVFHYGHKNIWLTCRYHSLIL